MNGETEMSAAVLASEVPKVLAPKAVTPEISEGAKRTQKIIEAMDLRRQERARLVAALKSREVEVDRLDGEARKKLAADLKALDDEYRRRSDAATADCTGGIFARMADLDVKRGQIAHVDQALANFRTQLNAELGKLDPARETREGDK